MTSFLARDPPSHPLDYLGRRLGHALLATWLVNWAIVVVGIRARAEAHGLLTFEPVTALTTIGVLGAGAAYAVVDRLCDDPDSRFLQLAIVAFIASLLPAGQLATGWTTVHLIAIHGIIIVACVTSLTDYDPVDKWRAAIDGRDV